MVGICIVGVDNHHHHIDDDKLSNLKGRVSEPGKEPAVGVGIGHLCKAANTQ